MLRIGLIILAIAAIAAAAGHVAPTGFSIGLAFVVLWYLFDREPASPAATAEELAALSDSLHESSTEFDLPEFPEFLRRIIPQITRGFREREVERLASLRVTLERVAVVPRTPLRERRPPYSFGLAAAVTLIGTE